MYLDSIKLKLIMNHFSGCNLGATPVISGGNNGHYGQNCAYLVYFVDIMDSHILRW